MKVGELKKALADFDDELDVKINVELELTLTVKDSIDQLNVEYEFRSQELTYQIDSVDERFDKDRKKVVEISAV